MNPSPGTRVGRREYPKCRRAYIGLAQACIARDRQAVDPVAVRPTIVQSGHERVVEKAMRIVILAVLPLALTGCIAKTALDVATLPVKAASKTVDVMTPSQSAADEKRGRDVRKQVERPAERRVGKEGVCTCKSRWCQPT